MPSSTTAKDPARLPLGAIALTLGEPAGIGPEITFTSWQCRAERALPPFALVAPLPLVTALRNALTPEVPLEAVTDFAEAGAVFARALPVFEGGLDYDGPAVTTGTPQAETAEVVLGSIRAAVSLAQQGKAAAIVTNPIAKSVLYAAGLDHPGHTELLAELTAEPGQPPRKPIMMLAIEGLRVVPVTVHIPLGAVPGRLSEALITDVGARVVAALKTDFGIDQPRLAVAGLNPHAGEGGALGTEETRIIAPAVATLQKAGHRVSGPAPADTLFHAKARQRYDAVLCMYHDQALIPLKTLDFDRGVNITLGLTVVRTSPDHGTAFDIAGKGVASPDSLMAALNTAAEIAARRVAQ